MSGNKNPIYILNVLVVGLLLLPSVVFALSLGGIAVNSKLGEPLDIEIELLSVTPEEIGTLSVGFASRSDFAAANIRYPENSALIDFGIIEGLSGQYFLVLSSEKPVSDTFLHFLISVNWSGGKVVREYTALMDPVLYSGESASAVQLPGTISETDQNPSAEENGLQSQGSNSPVSSVSVVRGDTLLKIVKRLALPDSISIAQGLTALLEANPDAFINQNMNRLQAGATLTVPGFASIARIDRRVALQNIQKQTADYKAFLSGAESSNDSSIASGSVRQSTRNNQVKESVETDSESDQAGENVDISDLNIESSEINVIEIDNEDQDGTHSATLRITQQLSEEEQVSAIEGEQGDGAQISALKSQLTELDESLLTSGVESEEIRQRLKDIQAQVDRISRLIEIEDTNLALGQDHASTTDDQDRDSTTTADTTNPDQPTTDAIRSDTATNIQTESEPAVKTDQLAKVVQAINERITSISDSLKKGIASTTDRVIRLLKSTGIVSNISNILDSIAGYGLKIIAGLMAIIIGLFFYRRRKRRQAFEKGMPNIKSRRVSANETGQSVDQISGVSGIDLANRDSDFELTLNGDMSYYGEEGPGSGATKENEVIQKSHVDPLAEADVYLAYNRDEEAIQVLKEAYASNPKRVKLAEKLLRIYYKHDERAAFDELAKKLKTRIGVKHGSVWARVSSLGREVSPDNDLYGISTELQSNQQETHNFDFESATAHKADKGRFYFSESDQSIGRSESCHESGTALELAKAYVELGEKAIAEGFIEEVINEGSEKQKAEAAKLIKALGRL